MLFYGMSIISSNNFDTILNHIFGLQIKKGYLFEETLNIEFYSIVLKS